MARKHAFVRVLNFFVNIFRPFCLRSLFNLPCLIVRVGMSLYYTQEFLLNYSFNFYVLINKLHFFRSFDQQRIPKIRSPIATLKIINEILLKQSNW